MGLLLMTPVHRNPGPPHLTPLPPLLSLVGEERGRMVGVLHTGGRAPQSRPPSRPPPAGGRRYECIPAGGRRQERISAGAMHYPHVALR
jgi:hypothetical protein